MASLNKVHIIGNVGKDPELRSTPSGTQVCVLSVASSRSWKDKTTGDKMEETEWHRVVFYDRLAEIAAKYAKKGKPIYVEGRLKTRKWDKDGVEHHTTEIIVENLQLLGGREDAAPATDRPAARTERPAAAAAPARRPAAASTSFDDDIPF